MGNKFPAKRKKLASIMVLANLGALLVAAWIGRETSLQAVPVMWGIIGIEFLVLLFFYDVKILVPLSGVACIAALVFSIKDESIRGFIFSLSIYGFGIYGVVTDQYLTKKEKGWCIVLVVVLKIVGICIAQLIASSKMKKRFKLNLKLNNAEPPLSSS